jgi:hypothetical protein
MLTLQLFLIRKVYLSSQNDVKVFVTKKKGSIKYAANSNKLKFGFNIKEELKAKKNSFNSPNYP